jgi:hypothetical protein
MSYFLKCAETGVVGGIRPRGALANLRNNSISIIPRGGMNRSPAEMSTVGKRVLGPKPVNKPIQPMAAARPYIRETPHLLHQVIPLYRP